MLLLILAVAAGLTIYGMSDDGSVSLAGDNAGTESSVESQVEADKLAEQAGQATDDRQLAVYVTGEVQNPGVVYVGFNSRVSDAVNACGGVLATADTTKVNMAQTVTDGMHIKVPEKILVASRGGSMGQAGGNGTASGTSVNRSSGNGGSTGGDMVNINTAGADELRKLKGIGPAMAQRILDYREANGSFQSAEELQKVKGIGKAKFAKLKDQVCL